MALDRLPTYSFTADRSVYFCEFAVQLYFSQALLRSQSPLLSVDGRYPFMEKSTK
jgi:hypothetical protein